MNKYQRQTLKRLPLCAEYYSTLGHDLFLDGKYEKSIDANDECLRRLKLECPLSGSKNWFKHMRRHARYLIKLAKAKMADDLTPINAWDALMLAKRYERENNLDEALDLALFALDHYEATNETQGIKEALEIIANPKLNVIVIDIPVDPPDNQSS